MAPLKARTEPLREDLDLGELAADSGVLFDRGGVGLAGQGVAWRGSADVVEQVLADIEVDDQVGQPGCGPVAFGTFPFDPAADCELTIPRQVIGKDADGNRWITTVGDLEPRSGNAPKSQLEPTQFRVTPSRSPEDWCESVGEAIALIRRGALEKVVLAREIVVEADQPFRPSTLIARLRASYPGCFLYSVDGYVGASPELLVERRDNLVHSQPMAGTTARRGDPDADAKAAAALLASPSYRHEHQVTIDMVHDTLLEFCSFLDYAPEPSVVALANVAHLATEVEGLLSQPAASVLELVRALHPTPAVAGRPRTEALAVIKQIEGFDRGPYGGAVGWVDRHGNGQWAVAIRGALLRGNQALVYAGNGIVADSDPATELAETRAKLQAMLGSLIRP